MGMISTVSIVSEVKEINVREGRELIGEFVRAKGRESRRCVLQMVII